MRTLFGEYAIDDKRERLDFERVFGWLSETYWHTDTTLEFVKRAAQHSSLVVGAYRREEQVGYLRVISDCTRFAYLCDVFVEESHRGKGLGKSLVRFALNHPEHQVNRWLLVTRDAHPVYAEEGFVPLPNPEGWMCKTGK